MNLPLLWLTAVAAFGLVTASAWAVWSLSSRLKGRSIELEELKTQILEWNRRLEERVMERTRLLEELHKQLQDTYLETVASLVEAMTAKDTYLFGHSHNVANNARAIAEELRLPQSQIDRLVHGCELHDLGKIAIPDAILMKAGPLTQEEYEIIKLHPSWGARILGGLTFMKEITEMVHQEHERWDGKGYPQGLKGERIRLEARIISVADALDAMTSDRPYRKRIGTEAACQEIQRCSGTQFDPKVAEACLRALKKGKLHTAVSPYFKLDDEPNGGSLSVETATKS